MLYKPIRKHNPEWQLELNTIIDKLEKIANDIQRLATDQRRTEEVQRMTQVYAELFVARDIVARHCNEY